MSINEAKSYANFQNISSLTEEMITTNINEKCTSVDFSNCLFGEMFDFFANCLRNTPNIHEIKITSSLLTEREIRQIESLSSECKINFEDSEGFLIGGVHTNWNEYYKNIHSTIKSDLKETTLRKTPFIGIELFRMINERIPNSFIDFGAASGENTIALISDYCCDNIHAIDCRQIAREQFQQNFESYEIDPSSLNIQYHVIEFQNFQNEHPVEFFFSNYAWPYRNEEQFQQCWEHTLDCVSDNGFIAGELFSSPEESPRLGITFHSLEQVLQLFSEDGLEILYFEIDTPTNEQREKYGDLIPWGNLYRFVLRKSLNNFDESYYSNIASFLNELTENSKTPRYFNSNLIHENQKKMLEQRISSKTR